jgi:hypothetical protein
LHATGEGRGTIQAPNLIAPKGIHRSNAARKTRLFIHRAGFDPEYCAIAPVTRGDRVHCDHVDPGASKLFADLRNRAGPVVSLDKEHRFARANFQLQFARDFLELGGIGGNEIDLRPARLRRSAKSLLAPGST